MQVVERLIQQAAFRSEAALSGARMVFCLGLALRFLSTDLSGDDTSGGVHRMLLLLVLGTPIVFSIVVLHRFKQGTLAMPWLVASVLFDAALVTAGLGTNVVYPGSLYRGILGIPDTAALLVVMMAAGLRLSVKLALVGIAANTTGLVLLVIGDLTLHHAPDLNYSLGTVLLWPIYIVGAACFALLSAHRTTGLATHGARESVRLERARQNLQILLHGHHDAQAVLSSAMLNSDMLLREPDLGTDARRLVDDLREDLSLLGECVRGTVQRADGELLNAQDVCAVNVDEHVRECAERLRPQLAGVELVIDPGARDVEALVAGGESGLRRILLNLLSNARDAVGERRTSLICVRTVATGSVVRVAVSDDGPGFVAAERQLSTRLDGLGVGLAIVSAITEASGGSMRVARGKPSGALVELSFCRAPRRRLPDAAEPATRS